jgi:hypothetical protein
MDWDECVATARDRRRRCDHEIESSHINSPSELIRSCAIRHHRRAHVMLVHCRVCPSPCLLVAMR